MTVLYLNDVTNHKKKQCRIIVENTVCITQTSDTGRLNNYLKHVRNGIKHKVFSDNLDVIIQTLYLFPDIEHPFESVYIIVETPVLM